MFASVFEESTQNNTIYSFSKGLLCKARITLAPHTRHRYFFGQPRQGDGFVCDLKGFDKGYSIVIALMERNLIYTLAAKGRSLALIHTTKINTGNTAVMDRPVPGDPTHPKDLHCNSCKLQTDAVRYKALEEL